MIGGLRGRRRPRTPRSAFRTAFRAAAPVDPRRDHVRGPEDAPITVVEYGDFECPYCRQAEPVIGELLAGQGDLRYVWPHLPLIDVHPPGAAGGGGSRGGGRAGRILGDARPAVRPPGRAPGSGPGRTAGRASPRMRPARPPPRLPPPPAAPGGWTSMSGRCGHTYLRSPCPASSSPMTGSAWRQYGHSKSPYSTTVIGASSGPRTWSRRGSTGAAARNAVRKAERGVRGRLRPRRPPIISVQPVW